MKKMRRGLFMLFSTILVLAIIFAVFSNVFNATRRLVSEHPIERISVRVLYPMDMENFKYEITPDLTVVLYRYYGYDWSGNAEVAERLEGLVTKEEYDSIVNAIITSDFIAMPENHKPWIGADGPSQEIKVEINGVTYCSGGYFASETSRRFSRIWKALDRVGIFDRKGY